MRLFEARPLAAFCALFAAVSALAYNLDGREKLILLLLTAAAAALFFAAAAFPVPERMKKLRPRAASLALAVAAALSVSFWFFDIVFASYDALDGEDGRVSGYVTGVVYETGFGSSYKVTLTKTERGSARAGALLEAEFDAGLAVGDVFTADVVYSALGVDGSFDERAYYTPRGVRVKVTVKSPEMIKAGTGDAPGPLGKTEIFFAEARERISDILGGAVDGKGGGGLPQALLVGDRDGIGDSLFRDFKYIGAVHLLAVSGLHMTVLIGAADRLLGTFLNRKRKNAVLILLTVLYMALTGFSASVTRAGLMLILFYAAYFVRRTPDSVTSLFVAAAVIMAVSPASAGDVGLLLSVTAMLGCLFANKIFVSGALKRALAGLSSRGKPGKIAASFIGWAASSLAVSFAALLFTLPTVWLEFGRVSLLSPLSTLLLTLPVTGILYLSPAIVLTAGVPFICSPLSTVCGALCRVTESVASLLSRIEGAGIPLGGAVLGVCFFTAGCLFAALVLGRRGALCSISLAALSFFVVCAAATVHAHTFKNDAVAYVNYGKNDAFAVTDGVRLLVCDISDGSWTPTSLAVEKGKESGAERIEVYMLTHLHRRHISTLSKLLGREYVREVWLPEPETEDERQIYDELSGLAKDGGVGVRTYSRGDAETFGSITVGTFPRTMISRSTHPVLAAVFDTEDGRVIYVGASVHESGIYGNAAGMCRGADTVIFGIHGPVYKSGAGYGLGEDTRAVYASQSTADFMFGENRTKYFSVYGEE